MNKGFLDLGYKAAIGLSFISLIASGLYLVLFIQKLPIENKISNEISLLYLSALIRIMFLSAGVFVAMAFGFLGFGLFLIQAKGYVNASGQINDITFNLVKLSPGLVVIICATYIIVKCVTFRIEYSGQSSFRDTRSTNQIFTDQKDDANIDDMRKTTTDINSSNVDSLNDNNHARNK